MFSLARRIGASCAYRSGPVYKEVLTLIPPPRFKNKASLGIPLLTMCGPKHLLMLEQTLFTIASQWSSIPNVVVVSDGSVSLSQIRESLRWWPSSLEVMGWQELRDVHKDKGRSELVQYADTCGQKRLWTQLVDDPGDGGALQGALVRLRYPVF